MKEIKTLSIHFRLNLFVNSPGFSKDRRHLSQHVVQAACEPGRGSVNGKDNYIGRPQLIVKNVHHLLDQSIVRAIRVTEPGGVNNLNEGVTSDCKV